MTQIWRAIVILGGLALAWPAQSALSPVDIGNIEARYLSWCAAMNRYELCQQDLRIMKAQRGEDGIFAALNTLGVGFWCLNNADDAKDCARRQSEGQAAVKRWFLQHKARDAERTVAAMRYCSPRHVRKFTNVALRQMLDDNGIPYHDDPALLICLQQQWPAETPSQ